MKKQIFKSGLLLVFSICLLSTGLVAQEVSKAFHKEWTAGQNSTLDISNRYGDVVVETSDQNQVTIDVKVTVELPNRERAQKLLDYIDVQFSEGGDLLKAKTIIDEKFNFSGWSGGSKRFSIDYKVKMPSKINFTLSNRYGDSELEEINGLVKLDIKYGDLKADKLSRGNDKPLNYISLAYGKAEIESAGWLDATVRYSGGFTINNCQALMLDSKYSKVRLEDISSVVGETKYDKLEIDKINNLVLDAGYTDIIVGELTKKLKFNGGYGSITVDRIPAGFELLESDSRYIGVRFGIESDASYELDARTSYSELKFDESNFQHQRRIVENNSSETTGIVGKNSSTTSKVKVNSSYGSVKLY
ncbi:MAG: hypothetical protein E4H43_04285 [Bacteroidia bacterium]|nr:MAG: hypothetical protein E4H43_04285 [Bacteroidia bacterium]